MKSAKIFGFVVGALVLAVVIGMLLVSLLVNPNDFKPKIAAAVKDSTGRELNLKGDIKLSVFPWVALQLGPASLGNPPGFGDAPFLSFNRADIRVKLLPLLSKRLEVARVVLDGLDLRLVKHADGKANWQMDEKETVPAKPATPESSGPALQSIAGIAVTHGRVSYNEYLIENLDFETGAISGHQEVPVSLTLDANRGIAGETFALTAKFKVEDSPDTKELRIAALDVNGIVTRSTGTRLHYEFAVPQLSANLDKQTLSLPEFSLNLGAAKITGKLSGTKIVDDMQLIGSIALAPLVLKEFASNFGIALPKTQDPKALSSLSLGTAFSYDTDGATLDDLQIKLDDTTLKGDIKLGLGKTESVKFKLGADRIDLDRYRPPVGSTPDPNSAAANQPKPKAPADTSEPMTAEGTFTLAAAHAAGLDFTNLLITVDMKDNVTHLHPLEAQLYGGKYSGDLTYDARTATPSIGMDEHLSSVDVAQLLANTKAKGRASGKANVNIKGTARGAGADDIMKTLNGHFDASVASGALEGMDVGYELAMAQALLNKSLSTSVPNTHKTAFDAFKMSALITNGVAETKDLAISSAVLKVTGQGTINLPTSGINMTLLASVMKTAGTTALAIPLKVTGTYTDPSVKPDLTGAAKGELKQKGLDALKKNGLDLNSLFKKK
jgi:AsmA protein